MATGGDKEGASLALIECARNDGVRHAFLDGQLHVAETGTVGTRRLRGLAGSTHCETDRVHTGRLELEKDDTIVSRLCSSD